MCTHSGKLNYSESPKSINYIITSNQTSSTNCHQENYHHISFSTSVQDQCKLAEYELKLNLIF